MVPRAGIVLLKEDINYQPIGMAKFRTSDIPFDNILKTVNAMIRYVDLPMKMSIITEWDQLRHRMERISNGLVEFPKMDISSFPKKQIVELPPLEDNLMDHLDEPGIIGNVRDEVAVEEVIAEIEVGSDVAIYTKSKNRPWVGRVYAILPNGKFSRRGKK